MKIHSFPLDSQVSEEMERRDAMASPDVVNIAEYEALAAEKLPKLAYDFYSAGAEDEWTLRHNKIAFSTIRSLKVHVLMIFDLMITSFL
jgi:hypothetical protein